MEGVGGIEAGTVGIVGVIVSVVVLVVCFYSFVVFCHVYEIIGHFHFGFLHWKKKTKHVCKSLLQLILVTGGIS